MSPFVAVFGVPEVGLFWIAWHLFRRDRAEFRKVMLWPAIGFAAASAGAGLWGLVILDCLARRSPFDYGYEGRAWMLAAVAMLFSVGWIVQSWRKWYAWCTLALAGYLFVFWTLDLATL